MAAHSEHQESLSGPLLVKHCFEGMTFCIYLETKAVKPVLLNSGAVLPPLSAPVGRGANGADAMA